MSETFDVVVIGGGPAGENVVGRCAAGGLSVALVERELVGGECSYWGCIPSKTLIRPGDVLAAARRVPGALEAVDGGVHADAAFAQRDYMTSSWHDDGQVRWRRSAPRSSAGTAAWPASASSTSSARGRPGGSRRAARSSSPRAPAL